MPKILNAKKEGYINYVDHDGTLLPQKAIVSVAAIKSGIYAIGMTQEGRVFFVPISTTSDDLVPLPNFVGQSIINEVDKFWQPDVKKRYDRYGMVYKRGILMHGKQGTGKTCIITQIMEEHIKAGGIVFFCPATDLLRKGANIIREIQGNVKFLVVYEELDKLLDRDESGFLSLLDGEDQIDNVIYIATTNYLDRIPPRIKNRPSRFATVIEVNVPDDETRRAYLTAKIPAEDDIDLDLWTKATKGMTIDEIKDTIISVLCIGISLKEAVIKITSMAADTETVEPVKGLDLDSVYDGSTGAIRALLGLKKAIKLERQ